MDNVVPNGLSLVCHMFVARLDFPRLVTAVRNVGSTCRGQGGVDLKPGRQQKTVAAIHCRIRIGHISRRGLVDRPPGRGSDRFHNIWSVSRLSDPVAMFQSMFPY